MFGNTNPFTYTIQSKNDDLFKAYKALSKKEDNVYFGGRLAEYRYYDMHQVIASALLLVKNLTSNDYR